VLKIPLAMKNYSWESKKILVAEDEEMNYLFVEAMLELTNVQLVWARNGIEVLNIMHTNKDIDLILMDIRMPEMDGLTATKAIRKDNIKIPIIAQTAYAMSEDKNKCLKAGCDDYFTKPINNDLLLSAIDKYFQ
jgi:two-component system, cell cycle response regulator DivK